MEVSNPDTAPSTNSSTKQPTMQDDYTHWNIVSNGKFGQMLFGKDGDVMLDASTWEKIQNKLNEPTFEQNLNNLSKVMEQHHDRKQLVNHKSMKDFILQQSPDLYSTLLESISSERHGEKRAQLQEKRITSLIWQLLFFRNQKHGEFLDESAIFLELHGLNSSGMSLGNVMGFSRHPKTKTAKKHEIASTHIKRLREKFHDIFKKKSFQILMIDDFHNINAIKTPQGRLLTNATHMATLLMDVQPFEAVSIPGAPTSIHREVAVLVPGNPQPKICRGGISFQSVAREIEEFWPGYCSHTFLERLPHPFKELDPCVIRQSLKELRVYTREDRQECQSLRSSFLIDEVEKNLHSMANYQDCLDYIFQVLPELKEFLKENVIPSAGDWPTWYFQKKIICHAHDAEEVTSLIPELGQFHIYLNSSEDVVKSYHPVFKEIYKSVFGQRVNLPEKPRPDKVALCLVLAFCGWLNVRNQVINVFGQCKDVEFMCLYHLFDELVPITYLHYPVLVKGSKFQLIQESMKRLALMFIVMDRHHYNKASLSWISDCAYQRDNFHTYYSAKEALCSVITEKKVEIFHSKIRSRITKNDKGDKITETARLIARTNFAEEGWEQSYVPNYQRGYSDQDLLILTGLASESILTIFHRVANNLGNSHIQQRPLNRAGRHYGKAPYFLASFGRDFSTKSLPIGYRWPSQEPNPLLDCDDPACTHPIDHVIQRLTCGHTFHPACIRNHHGNNLGCTVCLPNLLREMEKLCTSWNCGLLTGLAEDNNDHNGNDDDNDDDDDDGGDGSSQIPSPKTDKDTKYFQSAEFSEYVNDKIKLMAESLKQKKSHYNKEE